MGTQFSRNSDSLLVFGSSVTMLYLLKASNWRCCWLRMRVANSLSSRMDLIIETQSNSSVSLSSAFWYCLIARFCLLDLHTIIGFRTVMIFWQVVVTYLRLVLKTLFELRIDGWVDRSLDGVKISCMVSVSAHAVPLVSLSVFLEFTQVYCNCTWVIFIF